MNNILSSLKTFGKSLLIFFLYLAIIPGIGYALFIRKGFKTSSLLNQNLSLLGVELLTFVIIIIIFRKDLFNDLKDFKNNWKKYLKVSLKYWLIGMGLMIVFNLLINVIFFEGSIAVNEELNRETLNNYKLYSFIALILTGPITEEIIFRLNFRKGIKNDKIFLIVTTIVFASMHLIASVESLADFVNNYQQLLYILPYASLGFAFGKIYLETKNICSSIIAHMFQNTLSVLIILLSMAV